MSDTAAATEIPLPEAGELVIASVQKITDYGAYVTLDEYKELEALLHISEISSSWVKNIRDVVREKQKVVLKVLRVNQDKHQIDVSLRRVSGKEKQDKLLGWKRKRKATSILEVAAQELKLDSKTFAQEALAKLEERYDDPHLGLEELIEKGPEIGEKLKLPLEWAAAIIKTAQQKIKVPTVKIKGTLELTCPLPDGINVIKKILNECRTPRRAKKTKVNIHTVGAPRYVVEIVAKNYRDAEKTVGELGEFAVGEIQKAGGQGKFIREA